MGGTNRTGLTGEPTRCSRQTALDSRAAIRAKSSDTRRLPLITVAQQRDPAKHRAHLSEVQTLMNRIGLPQGPTFLTLAGVEWDMKQWAAQAAVPSSAADWNDVRESLLMQAAVSRRFWPGLQAITLRTQFRTTYRFNARWVDQDVGHYSHYSSLMRQLAHKSRESRERRGRGVCASLAVLDMAGMMNCSSPDYPNGCGRHPIHGWTRDGLHPQPWVYHQYFATAVNVLADLGEACTVPALQDQVTL